jgi:hypothetical protein
VTNFYYSRQPTPTSRRVNGVKSEAKMFRRAASDTSRPWAQRELWKQLADELDAYLGVESTVERKAA